MHTYIFTRANFNVNNKNIPVCSLTQTCPAVVCMLGIDPNVPCRQFNRKTAGSYQKSPMPGGSSRNLPGKPEKETPLYDSMGRAFLLLPRTIEKSSPVTSIDQLYAQVMRT